MYGYLCLAFSRLLTGTVTLMATAKQQKAQLRREFMLMRQKWIENIRELIPEIIETAGWFYVSKMRPSPDGEEASTNAEKTSQTLKLTRQIIQVELMLDQKVEAHVSLKQAMHDVRTYAFASGSQLTKFEEAVNILRDRCVVVLSRSTTRCS